MIFDYIVRCIECPYVASGKNARSHAKRHAFKNGQSVNLHISQSITYNGMIMRQKYLEKREKKVKQ